MPRSLVLSATRVCRVLGAIVALAGCGRFGFDGELTVADGAASREGGVTDASSGTDAEPVDAFVSTPDAAFDATTVDSDVSRPDGGSMDAGVVPPSSAHRGEVLLAETFDDTSFAARGWYDSPGGRLSTTVTAPGSASSLECAFGAGATNCTNGAPRRHAIAATESVYVSYWARYDAAHRLSRDVFLMTDADTAFVGPGGSRLNVIVEGLDFRPAVRVMDNGNIDRSCIRKTDATVVGCGGGALEDYPFTEMRSVASCNGLVGDVDRWDCWGDPAAYLSSERWWDPDAPVYAPATWYFVEAYVRMNSVVAGAGIADGVLRVWVDGVLVVSTDRVLLRTGAHPTMAFAQVFFAPYAEGGAPAATTLWIDDLTIARGAF